MTDPEGAPVTPFEIELKYRMTDAATGERLIAVGRSRGLHGPRAGRDGHNVDRYLDTPGGALAAAGYAGRLRTSETGTVITLKGLRRHDDGGATHRREELEGPADLAIGRRRVAGVAGPRRRAGDRRRLAARGPRHHPPGAPEAALRA